MPGPPRKSLAIVAAFGCAAMAFGAFLILPANPAGASTWFRDYGAPPVEIPPLPVPIDVSLVGPGVEVGTAVSTATGVETVGGVGLLACGTETAGACLVAGGVFLGVFKGTTKTLEWVCGQVGGADCHNEPLVPSINLLHTYTATDWRLCDSVAQAGYAEAMRQGGVSCADFSVATHIWNGVDNTWFAGNPDPGTLVTAMSTIAGTIGGVCAYGQAGQCNPLGYGYGHVRIGSTTGTVAGGDPLVQADGLIVAHYLDAQTIANCQGYRGCGILPTDRLVINTGQTGPTTAVLNPVPLDASVAVHGRLRRLVATGTCTDIDLGGSYPAVTGTTAWFWDDERNRFPIQMPTCPLGNSILKHLQVQWVAIEGDATQLFTIDLPDHLRSEIPKECWTGTNSNCTPTVLTRSGVDYCQMSGHDVLMSFCTDASQALQTQTQTQTALGTTNPVQPRPVTTPVPLDPPPVVITDPGPYPGSQGGPGTSIIPGPSTIPGQTTVPGTQPIFGPPVTETPGAPDQQGDCFPSGWGLLNPVDWVVKPGKCVLRWAFIPSEGLQVRVDRIKTKVMTTTAVGAAIAAVGHLGSAITGGLGAASAADDCLGPAIDMPGQHQGQPDHYHPFSSCNEPAASFATWVRDIASAVVAAGGLISAYNLIGRRFGWAPIGMGGGDPGAEEG